MQPDPKTVSLSAKKLNGRMLLLVIKNNALLAQVPWGIQGTAYLLPLNRFAKMLMECFGTIEAVNEEIGRTGARLGVA